MKKKWLLVLVIACLIFVGCNKEEVLTISKDNEVLVDQEVITHLKETSKSYDNLDLNPIVLLGQQGIDAPGYMGINYYYLCESNDGWKIVGLYDDLDGFSLISSMVNFDYMDYYSKDNNDDSIGLANQNIPSIVFKDEKVQDVFNQAINKQDTQYLPVTLLAYSENNYLVLCKTFDSHGSTILKILTIKDKKITNVYDFDISKIKGIEFKEG